jgi:hypothetical protein
MVLQTRWSAPKIILPEQQMIGQFTADFEHYWSKFWYRLEVERGTSVLPWGFSWCKFRVIVEYKNGVLYEQESETINLLSEYLFVISEKGLAHFTVETLRKIIKNYQI